MSAWPAQAQNHSRNNAPFLFLHQSIISVVMGAVMGVVILDTFQKSLHEVASNVKC